MSISKNASISIWIDEKMRKEFLTHDTPRHKQTKLPSYAYLYFPTLNDKVDYDEKKQTKTLRRIFEGDTEYLPFEKVKLIQLTGEIAKQNTMFGKISLSINKTKKTEKITFPYKWTEADNLRFLQSTQYNINKTIDNLMTHFNWRSKNINLSSKPANDSIIRILNSGFIYVHGRDNRFRPVIHIITSVYIEYKNTFKFEEWEASVIYFIEYIIHNLLLPGQIENWDIICDLQGLSVTSIPDDLKKILNILQNNYRCRLFQMFIINVGGMLTFGWSIIKRILDPVTVKKIKLLKASQLSQICEFINPSQLEKQYGGIAENRNKERNKERNSSSSNSNSNSSSNRDDYFFPPIFPSDNYMVKGEKIDSILISEIYYKELVMKKPKIVRSPYITFEMNDGIIFVESINGDINSFYMDGVMSRDGSKNGSKNISQYVSPKASPSVSPKASPNISANNSFCMPSSTTSLKFAHNKSMVSMASIKSIKSGDNNESRSSFNKVNSIKAKQRRSKVLFFNTGTFVENNNNVMV